MRNISDRFDKVDEKFDKIEQKFEKVDEKFDSLSDRIVQVEKGQAEIKGDIKALDTKVEQLDKRLANQEFLNRGVFIGLLLALLGGVINAFGWIPKG